MKKMKRLAALFLAVVMIMAMGMTAMAAGSITIKDTEENETYTLYKVFDVTKGTSKDENGKDKDVYSYTIPVDENGDSKINVEDSEFLAVFKVVNNGGKTYVERRDGITDTQITAYLKKNIETIGTQVGETLTADGVNDVVFAAVDDGYYYVKSSLEKADGAAVMVSTSVGGVTIREKNDLPGWGDGVKTADKETYYVGEKVHYTLTYGNALNYADGEKVYQYKVEDTPGKGLNIVEDTVKITINGKAPETKDYTGKLTENGITINWTTDGTVNGDFLYEAPATIVVEYDAIVTKDAIGNNGATNEAVITYNGKTPENTDKKTKTVYTGKITIDKYDGADEANKLKATFVIALNADHTSYLKYDPNAAEGTSKFSSVSSVADATKYVTGPQEAGDPTGNVVFNNTLGAAAIEGLEAGTYYLIETEAPKGYNLMEGHREITLTTSKETENEDPVTGNKVTVVYMEGMAEVENNAGSTLPSTGGIGTTIFYVVGGIMVLGAGVLLITKKRMSARD